MLVIGPVLCCLSFALQQLEVPSGPLGHSPRTMLAVVCSFCLPQRHLERCFTATGSFRVRGSSHQLSFSSSWCFCNKISNVFFLKWQEGQGSSHFKKVSFNCIKKYPCFSKQFFYTATGLWEQPHICKMQTTSELLELQPACCKGWDGKN